MPLENPQHFSVVRMLDEVGYRYGLIMVWLVLFALFGVLRPSSFLTGPSIGVMFGSQAALIILALALVTTLSVGEFDMSVTGTLGLSATLVAVLNGVDHVNVLLAILVGLASGPAVGMVNGWFVVVLGMDGFIITLGMSTLLVGIAMLISQSQAIGGISLTLTSVMNYRIIDLSFSFYFALLVAVLLWYVLTKTPLGRHMLFIGHNREVARLVGTPVGRIRFGAFVAGGLMAAMAGVVEVAISGGFLADTSQTLLLPAFAAAFLGAATIAPGRFNAWGTVISILFLNTGITGLELVGLSGISWISDVFYGSALVVAVTLSGLMSRRRKI